jgi:hypothetical protein
MQTDRNITRETNPPPLPFSLCNVKRKGDDWIQDVDPAAREALLKSSVCKPQWSTGPRITGAVAQPIGAVSISEPQS